MPFFRYHRAICCFANICQISGISNRCLSPGSINLPNWLRPQAIITQAEQAQAKAEACKREMLEAYQQRELSVKTILELLRDSRDILTGANSRQMKILGQWGFDVREVRSKSTEASAATKQD